MFEDEPDEEKPEGGGGGSSSPDKATPPEAENDEDIGQNDNTGESQGDGGNEDTGGSQEDGGNEDTEGSQEEDGTGDTDTGGTGRKMKPWTPEGARKKTEQMCIRDSPCFYRHITDVGYRIPRFRICGRQPDRVSAGEQEDLRLTCLLYTSCKAPSRCRP